jgi:hypothetical protein
MENGEWRMENGEWRMENGEWRMENGEWGCESKEQGSLGAPSVGSAARLPRQSATARMGAKRECE